MLNPNSFRIQEGYVGMDQMDNLRFTLTLLIETDIKGVYSRVFKNH